MGLLSSIVPGVREFRTPFVTGALWISALALLGYSLFDGEAPNYRSVNAIRELLGATGATLSLAALATLAFIVGTVSIGISENLANHPKREYAVTKLAHAIGDTKGLSDRTWFGRRRARAIGWVLAQSEVPSGNARYTVKEAVHAKFPKVPPYVRDELAGLVFREFELVKRDLSFRAPEQYQNYDRINAEYELRNGLWLPMAILSAVLATMTPSPQWVVVAGVGVGLSVALKLQAISRRQRADEYIAQSIYSSWAAPPVLTGIARRFEDLENVSGKDVTEADLVAAVVEYLLEVGWERDAGRVLQAAYMNSPQGDDSLPVGLISALAPWAKRRANELWHIPASLVNPPGA